MTDSTWQTLGFWYLVGAAPLSFGQRNGSPQYQSMLCIFAAVGLFITEIFIAVGWSTWKEIGVSDVGQWTNVIVFAIFFILCVLGADKPQIKLADFKSYLYFGNYILLAIVFLYTLMFIFATDNIMDAYGFGEHKELGAEAKKLIRAATALSFPQTFLFILCAYTAQFVSVDALVTYGCNRFLFAAFLGAWLFNCAGASAWSAMNVGGVFDKFISGVKFNCWLCFGLMWLFYIPMALSDKDVLSFGKKEQPDKKAKEVDAEKAADKTEAVEPLLAPAAVAPLVPLATTSVPQYQSYTIPAASYASPTAYATYAQPTTFAPITTGAYAPSAYPGYTTAGPVYTPAGTAPVTVTVG